MWVRDRRVLVVRVLRLLFLSVVREREREFLDFDFVRVGIDV